MKNFFLLTLVTFISLTTANCNKDDDKDAETPLTGATWKITKLEIDGKDSTSTLNKCDLMDTYLFTDDGKFTFTSHELQVSGDCSTGTSSGKWVADNSVAGSRRFNVTFNGDEKSTLFIIEGTVLREDFIEGPNNEGLKKTYTYYYSRQ